MRAHFNATFYSLVVVRDGDRYLLVEEDIGDGKTAWYLPAGGVHPGEDFLAAGIRETKEEAGLTVDLLGLLGADQVLAKDGLTTKIRLVFLGKVTGGKVKSETDSESVRAGWFYPNEIDELPLRHAEVNDWIRAAERLRHSRLPQFKCHTPKMLG